jgi:hypothetical protein
MSSRHFKDAYYDWIDENDTYPSHSHKWIVGLYNKYEGVEALHRYFGPFETKNEAWVFAADYREKYTKPGFISNVRVLPLCSIVE